MRRAYASELLKLRRPAVLGGALLVAALALLSTVLAFALAKDGLDTSSGSGDFVPTLTQLTRPAGLALGFVSGMSLIGLLVFVVCVVSTTSEYGHGTLRAVLLQQPRRTAWLSGKLLALLTVVAATLAVALVVSVLTALAMSRVRGVDIDQWLSASALASAGGNYLNALLAATFLGAAGTALAVLLRSTGLALAVGIAWTFPIEHIIQNAWSGATRVFPGLLFDAVGRGGVPGVSYRTALLAVTGYAVLGLAMALASFRRRDVTA